MGARDARSSGGASLTLPLEAWYHFLWGKAYPPSRILQVLREIGDSAVLASTCPKVMDVSSRAFGYRPAVGAVVERIAEAL